APIEQNVPGRRRDQIGGKPIGADIVQGPDDPEWLSWLEPGFQISAQCGRHGLLPGKRTANVRERRRKRLLPDRPAGENCLDKDKNEPHRCAQAPKMKAEPDFCNEALGKLTSGAACRRSP